MEEKIKHENPSVPPIEETEKSTPEGKIADIPQKESAMKPEIALETRIEQLKQSIDEARIAFRKRSCNLLWQIAIWGAIGIILIIVSVIFSNYLLHHVKLPDIWTWQVVYFTAIRLTIIGALFSFAAYIFKLLSSNIQMYQHTQHKRAVLNAMPGFVESGITLQDRQAIYSKLVEMIIFFDNTGIIDKKNEFKTGNDSLVKVLEILLKRGEKN